VPFFLVAEPLDRAADRVRIWATAFPTREAAAAHAQRLSVQCMVVEAPNLGQAIQQLRAEQAPC
jgi:hypothetical protein